MNTQTSTTQQSQPGRLSRLVIVIALLIAGVLLVGLLANGQTGSNLVNTVFAATPDPGRCGMSQQEFAELPARLQMEMTETCNRPPDVMP